MDKDIIFEGGKGGGGSSFQEDDNTLKAVTWVKSLEAIGYGLQVGPVNGLKSIYLDNTAIQNADNSKNFQDVSVDWRVGEASQTAITGFEDVSATISVATDVPLATPVVRTVTSASVGKASVTIRLPQGLYNQNTADNKLEKTTLNFVIEKKLTSSGTWVTALNKTYNDKTTGPYEETFEIVRPTGAGTWDIRVRRITADSAVSTLRNTLNFAYYTEHLLETVTYPNVGLIGISLNASGVNATRIPVRSALWKGRIIRVPNVFNGETRTYSGVWNLSSFSNSWTNDPAWVIFDLATDDVVGLGLTDSQIDLASFYEASIYNSTQVNYTGTDSVVYSGPRYSFNAPIDTAAGAIDWMKKVASVMNATLLWVNGQLTLVQDRPTDFSYVFTNANVIDGNFIRSETPYDTRYTSVNVTWNAPADNYQQRVSSVQDSAGIALYGFQETNVAAFGCTSLSQAMRYGKWILDSSLNTYRSISFITGEIGATLLPGDVIRVYDNVYAGADAAGRLLSGSTTTVINLDRQISLSPDASITIWGADGTLFVDVPITNIGLSSVLVLTAALASAPAEGSIFQVTTNSISPETYRIIEREEIEPGKFQILAGQYDPNKYARIEGGIVLPTPVYSGIKSPATLPPTALTFAERSTYLDLVVQRKVIVSWTPVPNQVISGYRVTYTINGGNKIVQDVKLPFIEIDANAGTLNIQVQSLGYTGLPSLPVAGTYTIAATETTGSSLNAVTNLVVYGTAGTSFTTPDLIIQWTNPTTNGSTAVSVARFKVEVYNGASLLRSEYVDGVNAGAIQTYTYSYDNNRADGGPRRSITVKVYAQEASKKLSAVTTATFTNAAPSAPSGLVVTGGVGQVFVSFTAPTDNDYKGTIVWASLTPAFTPASGNVVYDGSDSVVTFKMLGTGINYVKVAHYDSFGKDYAGTGLNVSTQQTATPVTNAGIASGTSNPGTGTEGDLFFNTTDGKLYRYHSSAWTAAVPTLDLTGTITTTQITDSAITTPKIATNAITTNKLFVAGRGQEMNADPTCQDITAWTGGNTPVLLTGLTDIPTGGSTALSNIANTNTQAISEFIPIDAAFNYRIESTVKQTTGTLGTCYLGIAWYDGAKTLLASAPATGWPGTGTFSYFGLIGTAMPTTWTSYSIGFGPNETAKQHPSARYVRLVAYMNFNNTASSVCAVARHALIRKTAGEVIVDGTLSAAKIVANSITTGQIQAGGIDGDRITANTLDADRITANTITTTQIQAAGINADRLVAASISATQLASNSVTSAKINAGAITTDKLLVTGRGKALNDDPACMDSTAWSFPTGTGAVQLDATAPVGQYSIRTTNGTQTLSRTFAVEAGKRYKVSLYAKQVSGGGQLYVRLYTYAAAGGTQISYLVTGLTPTTGNLESLTVPGTWTRYIGYITPAATSVYGRIFLHTNWNTTGVTDICDIRAEEYIGSDLIVDGAITASKISASTITADKISINTGAVSTSSATNVSMTKSSAGGTGYQIAESPGPSGYTLAGGPYGNLVMGVVTVPTTGCSLQATVDGYLSISQATNWGPGGYEGVHTVQHYHYLELWSTVGTVLQIGSPVEQTFTTLQELKSLYILPGATWDYPYSLSMQANNLPAGDYVLFLYSYIKFNYGATSGAVYPISAAGETYYAGMNVNAV